MIEAGILEGDLLIVARTTDVRSGDFVVALIEGETTVKRFEKQGDRVFLVPENRRLRPIEISTERSVIQGKVIGLQRGNI